MGRWWMSISREDRRILFNTESLLDQMKLFLLSQPGYECMESRMREVFGDISTGAFLSSLIALEKREIIHRSYGQIRINPESVSIKGRMADQLWRAARLEGVFSIRRLSTYVPEMGRTSINNLIRQWLLFGCVIDTGKREGKGCIYKFVSPSPIRPKYRKIRPEDFERTLWNYARMFGEAGKAFSPSLLASRIHSYEHMEVIVNMVEKWELRGFVRCVLFRDDIQHSRYELTQDGFKKEDKNGKETDDRPHTCGNGEAV